MSDHTPGPWQYVPAEYGAVTTTEEDIAARRVIGMKKDSFFNHVPPVEAVANLYLMAAAPELLDFLHDYVADARIEDRMVARAQALIAKAEGN